ncbi:protein of unknown function [Acidithiobacillus ferrivorans]|uniref:Uncharacterized protein n=1 Tax=Acidithiobacillus ferrivorans TaxID=160808 RepID=A0ABY1MQB2_9PROT|nr:protein of unknown function [Acidithiobacillus ferrivorans]
MMAWNTGIDVGLLSNYGGRWLLVASPTAVSLGLTAGGCNKRIVHCIINFWMAAVGRRWPITRWHTLSTMPLQHPETVRSDLDGLLR